MTWTSPHLYQDQLLVKQQQFQQLLPQIPAPEVFASEPEHYRMRAEFRIWHQGERCFYAMFAPGKPKDPIEVTDFPVVCQSIYQLMPKLLTAIHQYGEPLKRKLFQAEFLASSQGQVLVSLIYHRPLDEQWQALAQELEQQLGIHLIGRSRKQRLVISQDHVDETLTADGKTWYYRQFENSFTQPNARVCEQMLNWACQQAKSLNSEGDLLELYCGLGTFTLPLAQYFRQVLATEVSKKSVQAGQFNAQRNHSDNVQIAALSSELLSQALNQNLWPTKIDQGQDYRFDCLFVDPPRAGLDPETLALAQGFTHILYVSCNPETLTANIQALPNHEVVASAVFDQFPYTPHLEAGVLLRRKNDHG